jgi:hypothetical protein
MGGGAEGLTERILCLTPGPEPTAIFERIKARHPNIEFTYVNYPLGAHPDNRPTLDKGEQPTFPSTGFARTNVTIA